MMGRKCEATEGVLAETVGHQASPLDNFSFILPPTPRRPLW